MNPTFYPDWQGRRALKSIFSAVAGGLWLVALALPAYTDDTPGLGALIFGWIMLFDETSAFIGWLANFPFAVGIFMFIFGRRPGVIRASFILSIVAMVFSFAAFNVDNIPNFMGNVSVSPHIGCYTWAIAIMTFMIGTIIYVTRQSAVLSKKR
jgi:hypothetical protein